MPAVPSRLLVFIAAFALAALTCIAPSWRRRPGPPTSAAQGGDDNEQVEMTLQRARSLAMEHNLVMLIARAQAEAGERSDEIAFDAFVPRLVVDALWRDDVSLVVDGERDRSALYGAQLDWQLPRGTALFARLGAVEFLSGQSFVPAPTNSAQIGLRQPLLQGFGQDANLIERAEYEVALQRALFAGQANAFLFDVERAYWALVLAQNDLDIKQRSYERALSQYNDTSENIRRGLLAEGEIFIVEENLVFFEQQQIRSEESLRLAQNELARLTRRPPEVLIVATEDLADRSFELPPEYDVALKTALERNFDVRAAALRRAQREETLEFERNRYRPRFDVSAAATLNGIDPSRLVAWQQVATAQNPGWLVGFDFIIPLDRRPDRAEVEVAEILTARAEAEEELERDGVRYGLQEALTRWQRRLDVLALGERRVALALGKLEIEQEKYQSGLSTLANVVLFQRDLDSARLSLQVARQDVALAAARVYQIQGVLIERAGVELE